MLRITLLRANNQAFTKSLQSPIIKLHCFSWLSSTRKERLKENEEVLLKLLRITGEEVAELFLQYVPYVEQRIHCRHYCLLDWPQSHPQICVGGKDTTRN